jgi:hypothetical protein
LLPSDFSQSFSLDRSTPGDSAILSGAMLRVLHCSLTT